MSEEPQEPQEEEQPSAHAGAVRQIEEICDRFVESCFPGEAINRVLPIQILDTRVSFYAGMAAATSIFGTSLLQVAENPTLPQLTQLAGLNTSLGDIVRDKALALTGERHDEVLKMESIRRRAKEAENAGI